MIWLFEVMSPFIDYIVNMDTTQSFYVSGVLLLVLAVAVVFTDISGGSTIFAGSLCMIWQILVVFVLMLVSMAPIVIVLCVLFIGLKKLRGKITS